jgi:hypothetical protein
MQGNNTKNLLEYLSLSKTSKNWFCLEVLGDGGERNRRVNMVQIMYTHVCKCKNIPVETVPGIRGGRKSSGRGEFKYYMFNKL